MRVAKKEKSQSFPNILMSAPVFFHPSPKERQNLSGVVNLRNNNVRGSHRAQIIHNARNALPLDHGLHGDPVLVVQASNSGRTLAGSDLGGVDEVLALDVVGAEHEFLRGDHALDAVGDQVDELGV